MDWYKDERGHYRDRNNQLIWCNPYSVSFKRDEIMWLLPLLEDMRNGFYVPVPKGAYAEESIGKRRIKSRAYFEIVACIVAEIDWRLNQVYQGTKEHPRRIDRYLLEAYFCDGTSSELLEHVSGLSYEEINRRINRALTYISGNRRRTRSYEDFVNHPKTPTVKRGVETRKLDKESNGVKRVMDWYK